MTALRRILNMLLLIAAIRVAPEEGRYRETLGEALAPWFEWRKARLDAEVACERAKRARVAEGR